MGLGHCAKARSTEKEWAWSGLVWPGLALIKRTAPHRTAPSLRLSAVITVSSVRGPGSEAGKRGVRACQFEAGA